MREIFEEYGDLIVGIICAAAVIGFAISAFTDNGSIHSLIETYADSAI